ncbi:adenine nucleotide alpha hydrolase family protein [Candidatus Woesearchaeota archaeon]|nr:adenine nucleotide alpha hydrolase family protein [Candidatus Woesearchaeota archaeon]
MLSRIKGKRVLVPVSGGKDSSALAFVLAKHKEEYNIGMELLYLHLGIGSYSDHGLEACRRLSDQIGIKLNVITMKDEYNTTVDDLKDKNEKICSACGTVKRYLMNKFAFENNFDFVATGHNLDDEAAFVMHNVFNRNIDQLSRTGMVTKTIRENKLIGRVKLLYYLTEKENMLYCILNKVNFYNEECKNASGNQQIKNKEILYKLADSRDKKLSIVKTIDKLKKNSDVKEWVPSYCPECGFPTTKGICKFCRTIAG